MHEVMNTIHISAFLQELKISKELVIRCNLETFKVLLFDKFEDYLLLGG